MVIAVDFDGTVVTHRYPQIGVDIKAVPVLKKIVDAGHQIVLYTMRSGKELEEAVAWFTENEIPLYGVNENPDQKSWTASPKVYAQIYIDDAALGAPTLFVEEMSARPFICWAKVEDMLKENGII